MNIAIFGLGYVGCVSAACLAELGHNVIGVDVDPHKVALVSKGEAPLIEEGLDDLLSSMVSAGRLRATADVDAAVAASDVSLVCVGTPSRANGSLDSTYVERVVAEIGQALSRTTAYHVVAIRSTLLPGLAAAQIAPILEAASGRKLGETLGLCVNPEFLRESTALQDFRSPPFTVIGEHDPRSGDVVAAMYHGVPADVYRLQPDAAAMIKYASNAYHALKVSFANEIGVMCNAIDVNSQSVMDVFAKDTQLNISKAYLKPGFAFGGSCLPKDLRALLYTAKRHDVELPLLASVLPSNDRHIQRVVDLVASHGRRNVALLGLSFKPGTDDLRESPLVRLAEALIGKGYRLRIFDGDVSLSHVFGRNREYIERLLPHVHELLRPSLDEVLGDADVLIVGKRLKELEGGRPRVQENQVIIDLTGGGPRQPQGRLAIV